MILPVTGSSLCRNCAQIEAVARGNRLARACAPRRSSRPRTGFPGIRVGPPPREPHDARIDQFQAVEIAGDLFWAIQVIGNWSRLVVLAVGLDDRFARPSVVVGGHSGSVVVGPDSVLGSVNGDLSSVRQDPLGTGVPEWHSDALNCAGVVAADHLDRGIALPGAVCGAF